MGDERVADETATGGQASFKEKKDFHSNIITSLLQASKRSAVVSSEISRNRRNIKRRMQKMKPTRGKRRLRQDKGTGEAEVG